MHDVINTVSAIYCSVVHWPPGVGINFPSRKFRPSPRLPGGGGAGESGNETALSGRVRGGIHARAGLKVKGRILKEYVFRTTQRPVTF